MRNVEFNKKQVVKYLIWTFALAYIVQIGVGLPYKNGSPVAGRLVMSAMMFVPALSVLLAGSGFRDMGWKPCFKKNVRSILFAWFGPAVLTALGTALYFLIFPAHLDLSGSSMDQALLTQLQTQGMGYPVYVLISAVSALTYAPLLNTFFALGEELGWRGFLYPQLKAGYGRKKGWLLGGVVWGAWHWPLIWLIGYEYGFDYVGFPIVGMLLFCVFTVALGIMCDWLYEKSGSIWLPSLFHGAINAIAGVPLAICLTDTGSARLLGPAPNGIIAELPLLAAAAVLFLRGRKAPARPDTDLTDAACE